MIEPKELRSGNWIKGANGKEYQVDGYSIMVLEGENIAREDSNPIPLDESILLKSGFEKMERSFLYPTFVKKYNSQILTHEFQLEQLDDNMFGWIQGNTIIHFYELHRLQNFWYEVTHSELNIHL